MTRSFVNCGIPEYTLIQAMCFKLRYYKVMLRLPYLKILLQYCGSMTLLHMQANFSNLRLESIPEQN
jgi:hypothetical protein